MQQEIWTARSEENPDVVIIAPDPWELGKAIALREVVPVQDLVFYQDKGKGYDDLWFTDGWQCEKHTIDIRLYRENT